jgi:hypothetical protein
MAKVAAPFKLEPDELEWVDRHARERGVTRQAVLEAAVSMYRGEAEAGWPELKAAVRQQVDAERAGNASDQGVGVCSGRAPGLGHVWRSWKDDPMRGCRFCDVKGREFFDEFTRARPELFARLRTPDSIKGTKKKADR